MNNTYISFLKYCLDISSPIPDDADSIDWNDMLVWAEKQSIVGIVFGGIQRADKSLNIPYELLLKWIGNATFIENRNTLLNKRCVEVRDYFTTKGFDSCILKGQGNALAYPNALSRTPGDIDVWVMPGERLKVNGSRFNAKEVIRFVKGINPKGRAEYHHIDFGEFNGVEVETHYRPTFMNNLIANRRLQRWMVEHADEQFKNQITLPNQEGLISVPTWEFNVVFQLSHIYRHIIQEGIGLRQIIDYYYLLRSNTNSTNVTNLQDTLRYLGLETIAGAMMWVLNEELGLHEDYLIASKDEKRGRVLLEEIMKGGNFGSYDQKNKKSSSRLKKNIQRVKRDIGMVRYFPSECLWEPVFRVFHYFWRLKYNEII